MQSINGYDLKKPRKTIKQQMVFEFLKRIFYVLLQWFDANIKFSVLVLVC